MVVGSDWWKTKLGSGKVAAVDRVPDHAPGRDLDQVGQDQKIHDPDRDLALNLRRGKGKASHGQNRDHPEKFLDPVHVTALDQRAMIVPDHGTSHVRDPAPRQLRKMTDRDPDPRQMEWKKIRTFFLMPATQDFHFLLSS